MADFEDVQRFLTYYILVDGENRKCVIGLKALLYLSDY